MKTLHKRCAGLDVHKVEVVACLRLVARGKASYEVGRFPTTTKGLIELAEWLEAAQCTHVAMEATGVYWKPDWHMLEGRFTLILANAAHIKGVPGRKSDVNDASWIADLLAHGLIRASFVPPQPIQEQRDLTGRESSSRARSCSTRSAFRPCWRKPTSSCRRQSRTSWG
jgi:transposase